MNTALVRGPLLALVLLCAFAVTAAPAHATLTPANADITGTARGFSIAHAMGPAWNLRCPRSDLAGRIAADGRSITATLTFSGIRGPPVWITCMESLGGASGSIRCSGTITFVLASSAAGTGASGDLSLDSNYRCTTTAFSGTAYAGEQTIRGCVTFDQSSQMLTIRCTVTASPFNVTLSAAYLIDQRITVS